ncbi:MAG TPA: glycogen debranching N-terminal domain-containing protein [Gaiellaceae bacterium]|nr:glycogen debranching N-terminal domain-containing protein [Gaiellaceae bacterium]
MDDSDLIILDGCTFMYSDAAGNVEVEDAEGFFYRDVRHLSGWHVLVDGSPVEPLSSRRVDYFSARIVGGDEHVAVRRDRFVSEGMHEDVVVQNLTPKPREVRVELAYEADFADVMEAQQGGNGAGRTWTEARARSVTLWHERKGYRRGTTLTFNRTGRVDGRRARFRVRLAPREAWTLSVDVTPIVDGERHPSLLRAGAFHEHAPKMPLSVDEWLGLTPGLETEHDALERTYRQSNLDLAALRIRPDNIAIRHAMPGGGVPWFMTAFGRDSLIAAYEALPFHRDLAPAALEALAEMQASEWDNWRDAEPGKIPHELRRRILAALGEIPHTPYYGSHDSTLWWLIVLDEYHRWSGDDAFVREHEPHARRALQWLEGPADLDADGYLEYRKRSDSEVALDNQCWKDSDDSIRFADGRLAEPPIATCEIQGYAYDARLRTARLMREVWEDEGDGRPPRPGRGGPQEALQPRLLGRRPRPLRARARRRQEPGRLAHEQRRAPALQRHRRRAARAGDGASAPARGPVQRLGDPFDVGARRRLQPALVPLRQRLAARHGDLRRGDAPLRVRRRGGEGRGRAARRGRGVLEPAARGVRRLRAGRGPDARRVPRRAEAAVVGGGGAAATRPHPPRPRRRGRQAAVEAVPPPRGRTASPARRARARDAAGRAVSGRLRRDGHAVRARALRARLGAATLTVTGDFEPFDQVAASAFRATAARLGPDVETATRR